MQLKFVELIIYVKLLSLFLDIYQLKIQNNKLYLRAYLI